MKKIFAIVMALMLAFTAVGSAFAAGAKSPTWQDMIYFIPAYAWTEMIPAPTMENIEFAKEDLVYFLGSEDYTIYEAFDLNVSFKYGIVKFVAPTIFPDANYMVLMVNDDYTYLLTPILLDGENGGETAVMDFTHVEVGIYHFYLIGAESGV